MASTTLTPANWLDTYPVDATARDLYSGAAPDVAAKWHATVAGLAASAQGDPAALAETTARHIDDLGLTFRIAGDEDERAWPVTPLPLIIGAEEWGEVERGLIQRATLFERLAEDIYGPQTLVAQGHLPAAVIAGSPYFARKMLGRGPGSGHFIHVYAADLARGPKGQWRVLNDRVRLATGIGYALENRLAMTRTTDALLADNHVRRLADFFARLREGIAADCRRERPRIALLTPGRFNQTYAEQAHLARYLGLPLVEGRDLSVQDDKLFVGTIAGPKRVDAVWRWVNTNALDPLTFDAKSQIGVANMFDAWAAEGLEIANWPGVEVLESPAFNAFMPRLCRLLLGEAPILPTVATWWCGQKREAAIVERRFDELALVPAFGQPVEGLDDNGPVQGASLDPERRSALMEALRRRPMDYCAQEVVQLSTTPAVIDGEVVPRPFTLRAFVARTADGGWTVMPGGFARIAEHDARPTSLIGSGDLSADCWIVDAAPSEAQAPGVLAAEPPVSRGGGILASQAADNLFWFGRYNERAELTVRIARAILSGSIEADGSRGGEAVRRTLANLLFNWAAIDGPVVSQSFPAICAAALSERRLAGGVAALIARRNEVGAGLRERFARDLWRIVSQPLPLVDAQRPQTMLTTANGLIERFSALAGLASENMIQGHAWRFLELGKRIERALGICRIARHFIYNGGGAWNADELGTLLDLCDSQIVYRSRYLTGAMRNPVFDLVLLDPENPRSLMFQVAEIVEHLRQLPTMRTDNLPEQPLREGRALLGTLSAATAPEMEGVKLGDVESRLLALSDAISVRYFLQFERTDDGSSASLLE
ncbi:putative circularly permuted ATP-grasp superfamily protein/putative alpha-E superfamily protein [Novosphingobium chloroacetimidivorans]|uniref:Putative circularly permuted ATP-grasp superfamily protein/putative alpha-E superfamily protein n=1 Tax=Novosphingobium chloroacetimidivorans TaxID=1428314 RepID=A0A7W7NXI1_9SPHN|nr:circularly permuted type 2 ATP-grasp protein [Novosphingobium chloroacetimidivorans]MBB4859489.1 putative circularly permuted ATP-grasp superfamily protein/putative alpha-E superfamily protein [Novosphingobium chloroacetimidivorans]